VFNEDVVRHYQEFLDRRRQARSADEYKPVTDTEWSEFEEHFDRRKVELWTLTLFPGAALTVFPRVWPSGEFYLVTSLLVTSGWPGRLL
jgi:hypothetical protein